MVIDRIAWNSSCPYSLFIDNRPIHHGYNRHDRAPANALLFEAGVSPFPDRLRARLLTSLNGVLIVVRCDIGCLVFWFNLKVPPAEVKLHYVNPAGEDALTPEIVRERYNVEAKDAHFVIWGLPKEGQFGFKQGIDEVTLRQSDFDFLRFYRTLPAKGHGCICLEINSPWRVLIDSKGYSNELESWTRKYLLPILSLLLPDRVIEVDGGYDA